MPLIRNCSSCGRSNRIPAKHLSDVGTCGACKAELPAIGEPIEVQVLVENATGVKLENRSLPVRRTSRSRLREVDFQLEEHECVAWNRIPRQHLAGITRTQREEVMQFLQQHRYIAVAIGGEVNFYGKPPLLN